MLWKTAVLIIVAASGVFAQDASSPSANREVQGWIVTAGGVPVPGAEVTFADTSGQRFAVAQFVDGKFLVKLPDGDWRPHVRTLAAAPYQVVSIRAGSIDLTAEPLRIDSSVPPEIIVTLAATQPGVKISGHVHRALGRSDDSPVQVFLKGNSAKAETVARLDGSFEFLQVPRETYQVETSEYNPGNTVIADRDITNLDIRPRWDIEGRMTAVDDVPVPDGLTLMLHPVRSRDSPTEDVGPYWSHARFSMVVPLGEYRVEVKGLPASYRIRSMTYGSANLLQQTLKVPETNGEPTEFRLTLETSRKPEYVRVSGRVTKPQGLQPDYLNPLSVSLASRSWSTHATLDADGHFEFPRVIPGEYSLFLNPGHPSRRSLVVGRKDIRDIEIVQPMARQIRGRVVVEGSHPLPQIWFGTTTNGIQNPADGVTVHPNGTFTMTMPEGEHGFAVRGLAAPYRVRSIRYGTTNLLRNPLKVAGESGGEILVTLAVDPSPWLKVAGRIAGMENLPAGINAVNVTLSRPTTSIVLETGLKTGGVFEFPEVLPGVYVLSTAPNIAGITGRTIVVSDRDLSGLDLVVPPRRQLVVRTQVEGSSLSPVFTLIVKYADGNGYQILKMPAVAIALGRTDFVCASDACTTGRMGLALNEPVVISSSGREFKLELPEGEYRLEARVGEPYKLRSFQYGQTDLLHETLKIQGQDSDEIVLTLDK